MTMNKPPEYLPEEGWQDNGYNGKPKNDFRQAAGQRKNTALWLIIGLLLVLLVGGAALVWFRPELIPGNFRLTQTAQAVMLDQTAAALDTTAMTNRQQATQIAQTSQVLAIKETATALSDWSISQEQATQIAVNLQLTQVAVSQAETQAARDAASTQLAINPAPATTVPGSNPPIGIDDVFRNGISGGVWQSDAGHWLLTDGTLTAAHDGAWLLTQRTDFTNYTLEVFFTPPFNVAGDTVFLLNNRAEATNNLALRLVNDGRGFTTIGLYTFPGKRLLDSKGVVSDMAEDVLNVALDGLPQNGLSLTARIDVRNGQLTVSVAGQTLLEYTLSTRPVAGAVGLHVPTGTQIHRIRILP